jgi:hypothetical protein
LILVLPKCLLERDGPGGGTLVLLHVCSQRDLLLEQLRAVVVELTLHVAELALETVSTLQGLVQLLLQRLRHRKSQRQAACRTAQVKRSAER